MKKYGVLNDLIKIEFGGLGGFGKESGIPKATLSLLINGKYGSNEAKITKRVRDELRRLRPGLDLSHVWDPTFAWYQKFIQEKAVVKKGFRIIVDIKLAEDGNLEISPALEGY